MTAYERLIRRGRWLVAHRRWLPVAAALAPVLAIMASTPFRLIHGKWWLTAAALLLVAGGLLLRATAAKVFLRRGADDGHAPLMPDYAAARGIYSIMRFPTYTSNILIIIGVAVYTGAMWYVAVAALACMLGAVCVIVAQEHSLHSRYGDEFTEWCRHTYAFMPMVLNWEPSTTGVGFVRALLSQAPAAAASSAMFCLADLAKNVAVDLRWSVDVPWLAALGVSVALALLFPRRRKKRIFASGHPVPEDDDYKNPNI